MRSKRREFKAKRRRDYPLPDLIEEQIKSYKWFLQEDVPPKERKPHGLEGVFQSVFPIESPDGNVVLEYLGYSVGEPKYSVEECKSRKVSYSVPLKAKIRLVFKDTLQARERDIYMGDIPYITERGTFIFNGAERVVVHQIHKSPGVMFSFDEKKNIYIAKIIPDKGSWIEFELERKKEIMYVRIDRKKKILVTTFLLALEYSPEDIIRAFYDTRVVKLNEENKDQYIGKRIVETVYYQLAENEYEMVVRAGQQLNVAELDKLIKHGVEEIEIVDASEPDVDEVIFNCLEREVVFVSAIDDEEIPVRGERIKTEDEAIEDIYSALKPGEPSTIENAKKEIYRMFFDPKRYDLGVVGRYKFNQKFNQNKKNRVIDKEDIINAIGYLLKIFNGKGVLDDIDHLGNRRVRSVGELLTNQIKIGFARMEKLVKERFTSEDIEKATPQSLIAIKPITAMIRSFFGSSQLSQFMDQTNPLADITHRRRLNALGPGGLSRERAGFEVRDIHYSHYGRMCPIETPEGPNIGLIVSMGCYTRINEYGFLETPYRKVDNGRLTNKIEYLTALQEENYYIAQANARIDEDGKFIDKYVPVRDKGDFKLVEADKVHYMDVSPKQIISVSAALIPFLEHDDANRALMGSNMQRQAVPILIPESPIVGTGIEKDVAYYSGVCVKAKRKGEVVKVSASSIHIKTDDGDVDVYELLKYKGTNQNTCFNQVPIVKAGDKVKKGQVIADGPAVDNGELALGKNVLVAFMPWGGYNFEDAIIINERLIKEDAYTSIHIVELEVEAREIKLGKEEITRDIPNVGEEALKNLDEDGIVIPGTYVKPGDLVVGKVTPKADQEIAPEYKLLQSIFGEKSMDVKDTSLRVPHGVEGVVIDVKRYTRGKDEVPSGVEDVVRVYIANKRKIKVGDKMAGRHGNKGVISIVVPEEDMPFMEDGTSVDIILNPLGVPSRMNIGQLLETMLGWAGAKKGIKYACPVFEGATIDEIKAEFESAGLPATSKLQLYDGKTGEPFKDEVTVGVIYMLKLNHLVDDKVHARSTGPYSLVTQQPLGGKAQFGGQRLGEMEVWALEAYGASETLQELLTVKSDDMDGRAHIYESIIKGKITALPGIPESFNVLVQELRGLCIDLKVYDKRGKQIPLTERDEIMIQRKRRKF